MLKKIGFSKLHVFPYSMRNGTKAALMPQVEEIIKKERVRKLLDFSKKSEIDYMNKFISTELEVLIEKATEDYSIGHTTNYLCVKIKNRKFKSGDLVNVKIKDIEYPFLIGE